MPLLILHLIHSDVGFFGLMINKALAFHLFAGAFSFDFNQTHLFITFEILCVCEKGNIHKCFQGRYEKKPPHGIGPGGLGLNKNNKVFPLNNCILCPVIIQNLI